MRLKLTIAYDGAPFRGWQSQPGGETVQDTLETALAPLAGGAGASLRVQGSGRTDTGVHALGQVAHFDPPAGTRLAPADWMRALNATLPPSIRILACEEAAADFHARFNAKGKVYRYDLDLSPVLLPHRFNRAWHLPQPIDLALLQKALALFTGTHDFRNFAAFRGTETEEQRNDPATTTRTIHEASLEVAPAGAASGLVSLSFHGSGFLYRMVRLLTGSAVRVGQGRDPLDRLRALLHDPVAHDKSAHCAPAQGLYLVQVEY